MAFSDPNNIYTTNSSNNKTSGASSLSRNVAEIGRRSAAAKAAADAAAAAAAAKKKADLFGADLATTGADMTSAGAIMRENMTKNVAEADIYNQQAGRQRGASQAKAGLYGTDTSAATEQSNANSAFQAAGINEAAKRTAVDRFSDRTGKMINASTKYDSQLEAEKIARIPAPVAQQSGGISIICTELFRQNKITGRELLGCSKFGASLSSEKDYR